MQFCFHFFSSIPYFRLLVFGIVVALVAWFSFRISCLTHLALQNENKDYIIFLYFHSFLARSDQTPNLAWTKHKLATKILIFMTPWYYILLSRLQIFRGSRVQVFVQWWINIPSLIGFDMLFPLDEKKARKRFLKSFGILGLIVCALTIGIGNFYVYKMSLGAKYLVVFSSCFLKTRENYISFAQFVYFSTEVYLLFNFWMMKFTIMLFLT